MRLLLEGRNLEEALNGAAQQYGVERWQLTYGVLFEKRGFLGGVKRVVIEADINEAPAQPPQAATAAPAPVSSGPPRAERSARGPRAGGAGGGGGGRGGRAGGGNRGGDRRERS